MTSYFDITPVNADTVSLGKDGKTRYAFTVTSRADMTVQSIVQAVPLTSQDLPAGSTETLGKLESKWLQVEVEGADKQPAKPGEKPETGKPKQLEFRPKETRKIAVQVAAAGAGPGTYRFKLVCALAEDPGAHSSSSASVAFQVPKPDGGTKPNLLWLWILLGVIGLAGIAALVIWLATRNGAEPTPPNAETVAVPRVIDLDYVAAAIKLDRAELSPVRTKVTIDPSKGEGIVIGQEPKEGEQAPKGSQVALEVTGRAVTVPTVVNGTVEAAKSVLTALDLTCSVVGETFDNKPVGTVLKQEPAAGEKVEPGRTVKLTIEGGGVEIPNLVGMTATNALLTLQRSNLQLGKTGTKLDASKVADTVATQSLPARQHVKAGTTVDLTIWTHKGFIVWDHRMLETNRVKVPMTSVPRAETRRLIELPK